MNGGPPGPSLDQENNQHNTHTHTTPTMLHGLFRRIPYRYLGCGFPLAEALYFSYEEDYWIIDASYTISGAFIAGHVITNAIFSKFSAEASKESGLLTILSTTIGTLLWELLASIFLPSIIVNQLCQAVEKHRPEDMPPSLPTLVGMMTIPVISYPLDAAVDFFIRLVTPVHEFVER